MSGAAEARPAATAPRLRALDGLRGVAAAVVVLHHAGLLDPGMSDVYLTGTQPASGSFAAIVTRTPLQLLFSGQEAVLVFFVLSGLVVALPALTVPGFSWLGYYPRRVLRLMLPIAGAVILASAIAIAIPGDPAAAVSGWAGTSTFLQVSWQEILRSFDVLSGSIPLDNPLWSLRYELLFSVMLPLYVVLAVLSRRRWWLAVLAVAVAILLGRFIDDPFGFYLPIFLLGTLAAVLRPELTTWVDALTPGRRNLLGIAALVAALVLIEARWIGSAIRPGSDTVPRVGTSLSVFGAALLVVLALVWVPLIRVLESRIAAWLGRISFSLYLVHVPILVGTSTVLRGQAWWVAALVGIPVSLAVAVLFDRLVERPSHRLSRRVGHAVDARFGGVPA